MDGDMLFKVLKISEKILTYDVLQASKLYNALLILKSTVARLFCEIKNVWCFEPVIVKPCYDSLMSCAGYNWKIPSCIPMKANSCMRRIRNPVLCDVKIIPNNSFI